MLGAFGIYLCKGLVISPFVTRTNSLSLMTSCRGLVLDYGSFRYSTPLKPTPHRRSLGAAPMHS
jgi:hypothetical protein